MMEIKSWIVFSIIAMFLFSISNVVTKLFLEEVDSTELGLNLLGTLKINQWIMGITIILIAGIGLIFFLNAINGGKIAIVTAIVSLSTVMVAILSFMFLGDRFSLKEIVGILLAFLSILILTV